MKTAVQAGPFRQAEQPDDSTFCGPVVYMLVTETAGMINGNYTARYTRMLKEFVVQHGLEREILVGYSAIINPYSRQCDCFYYGLVKYRRFLFWKEITGFKGKTHLEILSDLSAQVGELWQRYGDPRRIAIEWWGYPDFYGKCDGWCLMSGSSCVPVFLFTPGAVRKFAEFMESLKFNDPRRYSWQLL
jgi:hypothetical protein